LRLTKRKRTRRNEKAAAQIRNAEVNERGLELRKRFIRVIKALKDTNTGVK
jgi:hypothetical protein